MPLVLNVSYADPTFTATFTPTIGSEAFSMSSTCMPLFSWWMETPLGSGWIVGIV